ncbi:hypothetical protein B296_00053308, partial [Ensete ventricosum]
SKLRINKGSTTWCQSSVLGILLPVHSHPKQFPQLLEDRHQTPPSSPLSRIIL